MRETLRTIVVPAVITLVLVASFSAFETTFALFGHRRLGFDLATVGAVFAMVGVVSAVVQGGLVRPLAARLGDAGCLRIGLGAEAVGLVLLPTVHARVDLVLPLILVTAGQSLSTPTLNALVVGRVGPGRRARPSESSRACPPWAASWGLCSGGCPTHCWGRPFVGEGWRWSPLLCSPWS